jgi:tetratricopeptide (TPR) repeat protein
VTALGVYTATLGPTIDFWDCGEYVTTSHIVGVPHQPGTPLYVLVGRVFDVLFGEPSFDTPSPRTAWAVNFMSALFSALAVMMVYLIIARVARHNDPDSGWLARAGGLVGAFFLLFSHTFWNNAIEAEVYGLAGFMMTLLTWVSLIWYEHRTERRSDWLLLLLIYLCGLGVGFHLGSLLVYPAFFAMVWLATDRQLPVLDLTLVSAGLALFLASTTFITDGGVLQTLVILYALGCLTRAGWPQIRRMAGQPEVDGPAWRPFALYGLLLFLVGLSVHAMLMIRAGAVPEPAINQTVPDDFATLLSVLRREQYPPLNPLERQAPLAFQFGYYYDFLMQQWSFLPQPGQLLDRISVLVGPILLALVGVAHTVRRARPLVWLLLLGYLINADGLTLYLNFTDHEVRERDYFYFAAFLFGSVFIGLGTAALLRWTSGPLGRTRAQLAEAAAPPPEGRPFQLNGFVYRVLLAFGLALVLMALVPGEAKITWLGLFLFGSVFLGLIYARWLDRIAAGKSPGVLWHQRSWGWQIGMLAGLLAMVAAGAVVLYLFATPADLVFVIGVYLATVIGMVLPYGERRSGPRPRPALARPAGVRIDPLSGIAAVALVVIAALPLLWTLGPSTHHKWFTHDRSDNRIAYEYAYNILAGLDQDAIVFTNGDNDTFPIWYLQTVEHVRRDVTVVNLSLVNLPWYVKQLKRIDQPVAMTYTDEQIDALRPRPYRDEATGQVMVVPVREYVVADIIETNRRQPSQRPVFFAVTIPRENMARYYPFLQMEGLAYRLTETRDENGMPSTDPHRLLANVMGAYELGAVTSGDNDRRRERFEEQAGWSSDRAPEHYLTGFEPQDGIDYESLLEDVGQDRTDVFRDPSTANLLGNYPASIARAGFTFLTMAEELRQADGMLAAADTLAYDELTDRALVSYELALRFDPLNGLVAAGYYPALLIERGRTAEALDYISRVRGRLAPDLEESAVLSGIRSLVALERYDEALAWVEQELATDPEWRLGYEIQFRIHESQGDIPGAADVVERWREVSGMEDGVMVRQLEKMREKARQQEREGVERALRESGALPEDDQ